MSAHSEAGSGHTEGPWEICDPVIGAKAHGICQKGDAFLVAVANQRTPTHNSQESLANARLIAASPCLLEALLVALPYVEDMLDSVEFKPGVSKRHVAQIRAAIANATGGAA